MATKKRPQNPRELAVLVAYNNDGKIVYHQVVDIHEYYDEVHPWERSGFIKARGIKRMRGWLYHRNGKLSQEFESKFGANGKYQCGWAIHEDGTVTK